MSTLIIVSHPDIENSTSQNFLKEALPDQDDLTYHHLEKIYPNGKIEVEKEQNLLRVHSRIIFQFPFYWYQAPPMLKKWQDEVLTEGFAHGLGGNALQDKELGLVLSIGVRQEDYQAGGSEQFTISQLTSPFQALANKVGMRFMKIFPLFQFSYMTEIEKMRTLIKYQQYLSLDDIEGLKNREDWFLKAIQETDRQSLPENADFVLEELISYIEDLQLERLDLSGHQESDWGMDS